MIKDFLSRMIARPFRFAWNILLNPKEGFYNLARFFYRLLPHSLQYRMDKTARRAVYQIKGGTPSPVTASTKDITWQEFLRNVLSKRDQFKGVFIQEIIIDWGGSLYQRPQHIATALGNLGYLVIYRTRNNLVDEVKGFREVAENVWLTDCKQVDHIPGAVRSVYSTSFHIDPRSLGRNVHSDRLLVYEYIDHIDAMISGTDRSIRRILALRDFAFGGGADLVIASSRKLEAEAVQAVGRDKVLYIPNGVDVDHYRITKDETIAVCNELVEFHENYPLLVGYFGAIAPWLWYDVLGDLARKRPDLGFVYIGPGFHNSLRKLPDTENTLTLGAVDYKILPAYAQHFDVCFIPFAPGEIAHTTSPLKLFEYFALEKPVVTTSFMDECVAFPEVFHGDSVQSLSQAIDRAMVVKENPSYRLRLAKLADQNSWKERAKHFEFIIQNQKGFQSDLSLFPTSASNS
jgi:glycosyltransferase involved in cell wall biosynthesis